MIPFRTPWRPTRAHAARLAAALVLLVAVRVAIEGWGAVATWAACAVGVALLLRPGRWTVVWRMPGEVRVHETTFDGTPTFGRGATPDAESERIRLDAVADLRFDGRSLVVEDTSGRALRIAGPADALRALRAELDVEVRRAKEGLVDTPVSAASREEALRRLRSRI